MGRQHQGVDRPGVRQVPEGSREQEKMEETGCEIIYGAQATLAVKNCSQGPPAKQQQQQKLEENLCGIVPHVPAPTQSGKGLN